MQSSDRPGRRDRVHGKPITPSGGGARLLAVERDHPATRGAVIAFVTERSWRPPAWLFRLADCRTSIGDVGEQEPTSALWAGACSRVDRSWRRSRLRPAQPSSCDTATPGPADRRKRSRGRRVQSRAVAYAESVPPHRSGCRPGRSRSPVSSERRSESATGIGGVTRAIVNAATTARLIAGAGTGANKQPFTWSIGAGHPARRAAG